MRARHPYSERPTQKLENRCRPAEAQLVGHFDRYLRCDGAHQLVVDSPRGRSDAVMVQFTPGFSWIQPSYC